MKKIIFFFLVLLCFEGYAQKKSATATATNSLTYDQSLYSGMRWREVGPFRGGRSSTATGVRGNPNLYYFGTVGGGVWKTEDSGQTWEGLTDNYFGGTVGAIAVAESDPNVIYAGEGEQTLRNNVSSGWGVWKSTDAGVGNTLVFAIPNTFHAFAFIQKIRMLFMLLPLEIYGSPTKCVACFAVRMEDKPGRRFYISMKPLVRET